MMAFANHGMAFTEKSWLISLLGTCSMVKRKGLFGYSILLFKGLGDQGSWVARFDRGEIVRSQFVGGSHLHRKISMTGPGCTVISNLTPKELDLYIYIYILKSSMQLVLLLGGHSMWWLALLVGTFSGLRS